MATKVHVLMVFPEVMYGCESWAIKKAEHQRTDAFELWCWRRLLRVPWTARRSNQSILKEISPEYSLEGLMLKLKFQYFGYLNAGKDWRQEKGTTEDEMVGWQHWLNGHDFEQALGVGDGQGTLECCRPWGPRVRQDWVSELNWRDPGKLSPRLNNFPVLHDKQRALTWNQVCNLLTNWWWYQCESSDYKLESQAAVFEIPLMEHTYCLETFPNWDSRYAVSWDFPVLFKSGCWSKPNLMYPLLFLFLFSFNISILKES